MALTFPITPDGLEVDVFVNLEAAALIPLWQTGTHPAPIAGRGIIDTGSDITAVSQSILQRLVVPFVFQTATQGIGGSVPVNLYKVSLHILDSRNVSLTWLTLPTLLVMELPTGLQFDVLIGLDVIRTCKMLVDGPAGKFTLDS
jgi:hypothetical protein